MRLQNRWGRLGVELESRSDDADRRLVEVADGQHVQTGASLLERIVRKSVDAQLKADDGASCRSKCVSPRLRIDVAPSNTRPPTRFVTCPVKPIAVRNCSRCTALAERITVYRVSCSKRDLGRNQLMIAECRVLS
jgi:hypothetical protein